MTRPYVEEWNACRCGKEVQTRHYYDEGDEAQKALAEARIKLAGMTLCTACGMDQSIETNSCPENVHLGTGISACRLGWHHEGRCQPFELEEHYEELARRYRRESHEA